MAQPPARALRRTAIGILAAAGVLAAPAAAQQSAIRKARDEAAAEFVAETYPMTDALRDRARGGRILPYCNMRYPATETLIDDEVTDVSPGEQIAIAQAVDMQVVRQNLAAAGAEPWLVDALSRGYRSSRESFDRKTDEQKEALRQQHEDPASTLIEGANFAGRLLGLPSFTADEDCTHAAFTVARTPYHLLTDPADGDVFVIPRFSFRVCEKRLADPYSRDSRNGCRAWLKVPRGSTAKLNGFYQYSVEWPDGARQREQAEFTFEGFDPKDLVIATRP